MQNSERYKPMLIKPGKQTTCKMNEEDYLSLSSIWANLRAKRLKMDGFKCVNCGSPFQLVVHHIRYPEVWGCESLDDLITLCDSCHKEVHGK